eukprot:5192175-Pyramimonas_sp.AAC.1
MSIGWCAYSGAWHDSKIPSDFKRLLFLGVVYNASLSGLEANVLTKGEEGRLHGAAARTLGHAMQGAPAWKDPAAKRNE